MAPIMSHTSEYIWRNILKNPKSIFLERFPEKEPIDSTLSFYALPRGISAS